MRTPNTPNDADLAAFIAGTIAAGRRAEIEQWIASDRDNAEHVEALRAILATDLPSDSWNRARIWGNVESSIERDAARSTPSRASAVPGSAPRSVFRARQSLFAAISIAAAIVVIATGTTYLVRALPSRADSPAIREYSTRRGERATVQLSDGSQVTLAPDSRLRIAADFGGSRRRSVELEGEVQFDVIHDSTRQFSVRAGRALVVDIGTRFDLRDYPSDAGPRVAVREGAVTLAIYATVNATQPRSARTEGVLVRAGEVGRLNSAGNARTTAIDNDAVYFAWVDDQLVFARTPLRDVLETIARWFDVDVRVADPMLGDRLVTAEFSTKSPADMARALAQAVNATVVDSGRTLTLVPR